MSKRAIRILPDRYGVAERETMRDYGTDCVTPYDPKPCTDCGQDEEWEHQLHALLEIQWKDGDSPHEVDGADHREERPEELAVEHRYNGWTNYQTWNVALYLANDQDLYRSTVEYANSVEEPTYRGFIEYRDIVAFCALTPDGVHWLDSGLDHEELDEMVRDHKEEGGA